MENLPNPRADELKDIPVSLFRVLFDANPNSPEAQLIVWLMETVGYGKGARRLSAALGNVADVLWTDVKAVSHLSDAQRIEESYPNTIFRVQRGIVSQKYVMYGQRTGAFPDQETLDWVLQNNGAAFRDRVIALLAELNT